MAGGQKIKSSMTLGLLNPVIEMTQVKRIILIVRVNIGIFF
jgi:hypothetical protein